MSRFSRLLVVAMISASLAVFANGSAVLAIRKVALGVAMNNSQDVNTLNDFTAAAGRKPALWTMWSDWGAPSTSAFPIAMANQLKARSITPVIMWEPLNPANQSDCQHWSNNALLAQLADTESDTYKYVRDWAQAAKDYGGTVLLRFMHEMNGYWYVWGVDRCTNTPVTVKQLWRAVWNIFRGPDGVGATNVKFLWSVSGAQYVKRVWPSDNYVDYIGITAFNWGRTNVKPGSTFAWRSVVSALSVTMNPVLKLNSTRPVIAAELGSATKTDCPTCKPAWVWSGYPAAYKKWPRLKAIIYVNMDLTGVGHPDWQLITPPDTLQKYKTLAGQARFQGIIP